MAVEADEATVEVVILTFPTNFRLLRFSHWIDFCPGFCVPNKQEWISTISIISRRERYLHAGPFLEAVAGFFRQFDRHIAHVG